MGVQWGIFGAMLAAGALIAAGLRVKQIDAPEPPNPAADDTGWVGAPTPSKTAANGDFAALLRLNPSQDPHPHAQGGWTVRLKVRRDSLLRTSPEISFQQGRVNYAKDPFAWDELAP